MSVQVVSSRGNQRIKRPDLSQKRLSRRSAASVVRHLQHSQICALPCRRLRQKVSFRAQHFHHFLFALSFQIACQEHGKIFVTHQQCHGALICIFTAFACLRMHTDKLQDFACAALLHKSLSSRQILHRNILRSSQFENPQVIFSPGSFIDFRQENLPDPGLSRRLLLLQQTDQPAAVIQIVVAHDGGINFTDSLMPQERLQLISVQVLFCGASSVHQDASVLKPDDDCVSLPRIQHVDLQAALVPHQQEQNTAAQPHRLNSGRHGKAAVFFDADQGDQKKHIAQDRCGGRCPGDDPAARQFLQKQTGAVVEQQNEMCGKRRRSAGLQQSGSAHQERKKSADHHRAHQRNDCEIQQNGCCRPEPVHAQLHRQRRQRDSQPF